MMYLAYFGEETLYTHAIAAKTKDRVYKRLDVEIVEPYTVWLLTSNWPAAYFFLKSPSAPALTSHPGPCYCPSCVSRRRAVCGHWICSPAGPGRAWCHTCMSPVQHEVIESHVVCDDGVFVPFELKIGIGRKGPVEVRVSSNMETFYVDNALDAHDVVKTIFDAP